MRKLAKFFFVNRFIYTILLWCAILCYCCFVSTNVYVNEIVIFIGLMLVVTLFAYIEDACKLNEQEQTFLRKLSSIFTLE